MRKTCGTIFALILFAGVWAAAPADAPPPKIADMAFLVGSWTCTITKSPDPKSIGVSDKLTYAMQGRTLAVTGAEGSTSRILYDAKLGKFVFIYTDPDGGYNASTSSGWEGSSIRWTVDYGPPDERGTTVMTKSSPGTYVFDFIMPGASDPVYSANCVKS